MFARVIILFRIALVNIFSSLLSFFIGLVLLFGAALLVVGGSLFSTLDEALSKSIVGSISGHLQVYAARSKDPLEIYGKVDGSDSNLAPIETFAALKARLLAVPNVARVVPMGSSTALVRTANPLDAALEKLRALYRNQQSADTRLAPDEFATQSANAERRVRTMAEVLSKDSERSKELSKNSTELEAERAAAVRGASDEFWATFASDPFGHLEFLENKVAPLADQGDMVFVRCLGTDLDAYQATFDRMSIVEGGPVPPGHRGVLLPRFFTEEYLKLKNARRLDKIHDARQAGRSLADAEDKELHRFLRENQSQIDDLVLQMDSLQAAQAVSRLQALLKSPQNDLRALLKQFFDLSEANFDERYRFFYAELAPLLQLYRVKVGETMTLTSFGRSGSTESANVRVYGIFEFKGLEKSPLAGLNALVDLVSFRDLYGFLTAERKAELDALRTSSGVKEISRDTAEADLFGDSTSLVAESHAGTIAEPPSNPGAEAPRQRVKLRAETFPLSEVDNGVVLHVAVMLKDGSPAAQAEAAATIEKLLSGDRPRGDAAQLESAATLAGNPRIPSALSNALREVVESERARQGSPTRDATTKLLGLQAALKAARANLAPEDLSAVQAFISSVRPDLYVVPWNSAAGFLGKFIDFFRLTLLGIVLAFAFIALIVVTVGMTIATLQRTSTIGTLRAIGAQRNFIVSMVLVETVVLGLVFGSLGAAVGAGVVQYLHATGIPAFRDELYFFFSGPVLRPVLTTSGVVLSVAVTLGVSILAVLLPITLATRVAPIRAMQATE